MTRWISKGMTAMLAAVIALPLAACSDDGTGVSVVPNVEAVVFVSRAFENADGSHAVTSGSRQTIDYLRYVPGGGLFVLSPPTPDGTLTNLTEQGGFTGVDIGGIDLSFDALQVVFSMRHADDNRYHIYVANVDGTGDIRQLTFGDYNDVTPIFLPGERIAFMTSQPYTAMGTRRDEYERAQVSQLATIELASGDASRNVCSQNLSHSALPTLMSDGRVAYSRWEHLGDVNDVKLFAMNPDCTDMVAVAGQFNMPFNSLVQASEIEPGVFVSIGTSRRGTIQSGAVIRVDARSRTSTDARLYVDVQTASFTNLTPDVPVDEESPASGVGRYRSPRSLQGLTGNADLFLVSWADGDVNERNELAATAPNFGIYMLNVEDGTRTLVYDNPNTWDLYALPVTPRDEPPVITPTVTDPDPSVPAILGSIDVTVTSLNERVNGAQFDGTPLGEALGQAVQMRIIEGFSGEVGGIGQFGLTTHDGAAILGETPIQEDGSWRAAVPGFLPYHLQPIDEFGLSIRNQLLWIQAMPGETRNCGGCHESRSESVQPRMGVTTLAQQLGPDMSTFRSIPDRIELPWYGASSRDNIQDMLDRNCVSCHDGGASDPFAGRSYTVDITTMSGEMLQYEIPYLDLSDRPLEVYYEREVVDFPASYVSLMYVSAMTGDSMATGDVPPEWIVPGNARGSRVIEAMNVPGSISGGRAWADRPLHPEDQGVTVSPEDRQMLIRAVDLGGQYYSRWNVEGGYDFGAAEDYPTP